MELITLGIGFSAGLITSSIAYLTHHERTFRRRRELENIKIQEVKSLLREHGHSENQIRNKNAYWSCRRKI